MEDEKAGWSVCHASSIHHSLHSRHKGEELRSQTLALLPWRPSTMSAAANGSPRCASVQKRFTHFTQAKVTRKMGQRGFVGFPTPPTPQRRLRSCKRKALVHGNNEESPSEVCRRKLEGESGHGGRWRLRRLLGGGGRSCVLPSLNIITVMSSVLWYRWTSPARSMVLLGAAPSVRPARLHPSKVAA